MMFAKLNYFYFAIFAVDLLASTGDSTLTWSSPIITKLRSNDSDVNPLGRPITDDEESWISSLINIGAIISPYFYGFLASRYGRKYVLLSIGVPHFIAFVTFAFARNVYLFYFGRLLGGLAVGGGYTLMPLYIAEVTDSQSRGFFSVLLNIFWTFGNLLPYIIGPYVSIMAFNLILATLPTLFITLFATTGVETPYYLVEKQQYEKAERSLQHLRNTDKAGIQKELEDIKKTVDNEVHGNYLDLIKTRKMRKALLISLVLVMAQQLSGINAILSYLQPIFDATGSDISSDIASTICGLILFVTSFLPPLISNRLGRRVFLTCSCFGMMIALIVISVYFYLNDETDYDTSNISWLPILGIVVFIFFFNFGIGPLPWTVSAELFPTSVKSEAASIVSSVCWLTSFIITKFFTDMNNAMGESNTFLLYAGFTLIAGLFVIFYVPETKDKTFNEIQDIL